MAKGACSLLAQVAGSRRHIGEISVDHRQQRDAVTRAAAAKQKALQSPSLVGSARLALTYKVVGTGADAMATTDRAREARCAAGRHGWRQGRWRRAVLESMVLATGVCTVRRTQRSSIATLLKVTSSTAHHGL